MLLRLLTKLLFGSSWALKQRCLSSGDTRVGRWYRRLYALDQEARGASIAWNAVFANEPCLPHGTNGIFVSGAARIGRDCVLFQQVTIGSNALPGARGRGAPTIGDRCYIGAGAKIVGRVAIGNDVRIGANAVVHRDVPDNATVVAGPQVTIERASPPDNRYFTWDGRWMAWQDGRFVPVTDTATLDRLSAPD